MVVLQIACAVGIIAMSLVGALIAFSVIWLILYVLEHLMTFLLGEYLRHHADGKSTHSSSNAAPKFKLSNQSIYFINCLKCIYDWLKSSSKVSYFFINFPTCRRHLASNKMDKNQKEHRY